MHQVAVLFTLAEKTKPWTGVAGAFVEHQHLFYSTFRQIFAASKGETVSISPCCQANNFHAKDIWANISLGGVFDETMSRLEPLKEARGMPTQKYPELFSLSIEKNI